MKKIELSKKQQKYLGYCSIALAVILMALLTWAIGKPLLSFASKPERFRAWVEARGILGKLAYIGMVIVQVIVALIPGEPFEIAAGYAFGAVEGTVLSVVSSTVGSMIVFSLVRLLGVRLVEVFFSMEKLKKLRFLKNDKRRDLLFLIIFMIPGTPKDLLCYFAGLTDISFVSWLLICSLGRLPSIVTSTIGGDALGTKNYWFAAAVFAVTLAVSGLGILIYNLICVRHNEKKEDTHTDVSAGN